MTQVLDEARTVTTASHRCLGMVNPLSDRALHIAARQEDVMFQCKTWLSLAKVSARGLSMLPLLFLGLTGNLPVAEAAEVPPAYRGLVEHQAVVRVNGREYVVAKIDHGGRRFEEVAFDEDGGVHPASLIRESYIAQFERYGRLHPTLCEAIGRHPSVVHRTMIWLNVTPLPTLARPAEIASTSIEEVMADLESQHRRHVAVFDQEKSAARQQLELAAGELEKDLSGTPFVVANLSADRIRRLSERDQVRMVLLADPSAVEDLTNAMSIAGANTVIGNGVTGNGIKVAVYEDCPDDTSGLVIAGSYTVSQGMGCAASTHARHTTGMIRNTTSVSGFAPGASVYSADEKNTLDALAWAIDTIRVSAVNQSFHRGVEIGDGLQADDLYKDYKVLHYPFPTIVHAAGNWCASGASCYEGGDDVLDEFVNHKGFNTISIANHNDAATRMAASSCFVNPTSLHSDRELPELSANGTDVTAVALTMSGTSMASPAVTGSVALLQEAQPVLRIWPEGIRALLFAGAKANIPIHNGQLAGGGGPAADAPNLWWNDVDAGRDAFDGAGALNIAEAWEISKHRHTGSFLAVGWDIGTLVASSSNPNTGFDPAGLAKKRYLVTIPPGSAKKHVRVALAWNSTATISHGTPPAYVYASALGMDLDIRIVDETNKAVARSSSYDNSYEVADFDGVPGKTYTIQIKKASANAGAWSWFGIAWDLH